MSEEKYFPVTPVYGRKEFSGSVNLHSGKIPDEPLPPDSVYELIRNELLNDAQPGLNLATFCNESYTDPWSERIVHDSIKKNFIDHTEYPGTNLAEKRSIRMIARELGTEFDEDDPEKHHEEADAGFYGAATIGSSEAVMLGLIAHKFIWNFRQKILLRNQKQLNIAVDPRDRPVVLMSSQVHGCWDKFCRYYDVIPLYVECNSEPYAIHNGKIIYDILNTEIDDKSSDYARYIRTSIGYTENQTGRTIGELVMCVGTVIGTTFTGNYDNVPDIDNYVDQYCLEGNSKFSEEQQKQFNDLYKEAYSTQFGDSPVRIPEITDIPIHVDAASSGFVLMFSSLEGKIKFNFRDCPKRVLSINMSNHKFGMTFTGMGSVIFKNSRVVDRSLVYNIAYLGGNFDDYTVNFSRGSSMIVMQYYNLLRFGRSGYRSIMDNCLSNSQWFVDQLNASKLLSKYLWNVSNLSFQKADVEISLPIIALTWKNQEELPAWDLTDLSDELAQKGWVVPAYSIPRYTPEDTDGIPVLRIVVQQVVSRDKLSTLINHMEIAIEQLEKSKLPKVSEKRTVKRYTSCLC